MLHANSLNEKQHAQNMYLHLSTDVYWYKKGGKNQTEDTRCFKSMKQCIKGGLFAIKTNGLFHLPDCCSSCRKLISATRETNLNLL